MRNCGRIRVPPFSLVKVAEPTPERQARNIQVKSRNRVGGKIVLRVNSPLHIGNEAIVAGESDAHVPLHIAPLTGNVRRHHVFKINRHNALNQIVNRRGLAFTQAPRVVWQARLRVPRAPGREVSTGDTDEAPCPETPFVLFIARPFSSVLNGLAAYRVYTHQEKNAPLRMCRVRQVLGMAGSRAEESEIDRFVPSGQDDWEQTEANEGRGRTANAARPWTRSDHHGDSCSTPSADSNATW